MTDADVSQRIVLKVRSIRVFSVGLLLLGICSIQSKLFRYLIPDLDPHSVLYWISFLLDNAIFLFSIFLMAIATEIRRPESGKARFWAQILIWWGAWVASVAGALFPLWLHLGLQGRPGVWSGYRWVVALDVLVLLASISMIPYLLEAHRTSLKSIAK